MKHDKKNITAMVTGMVIGAALASEAAAGIVAEPTWQKIYVDGRQVSMTAYCSSHQRPPCGAWHRSFDGRRSTDARRAGAGR